MSGLVESLKDKGELRSGYTELYVDDEDFIGQYRDNPRSLAEEILDSAVEIAEVIFRHKINSGYTVVVDLRGLTASIHTEAGPVITIKVVLHYKPGVGLKALSIFQRVR